MPISAERLQRIRRFPELIDYLHDELDWPTEDFAPSIKPSLGHLLRRVGKKKRLPIVVVRRKPGSRETERMPGWTSTVKFQTEATPKPVS